VGSFAVYGAVRLSCRHGKGRVAQFTNQWSHPKLRLPSKRRDEKAIYKARYVSSYGIPVMGQMIQRCTNPNNIVWKYYGGRGSTVCDRWRYGDDGLSGFEYFLLDVGLRPGPEYIMERFPDKHGPYVKSNFRWATRRKKNDNAHGSESMGRRPAPALGTMSRKFGKFSSCFSLFLCVTGSQIATVDSGASGAAGFFTNGTRHACKVKGGRLPIGIRRGVGTA